MKKIKLHHNELELIGQTRKDGKLYSLYYYCLEPEDKFDSGLDYYNSVFCDEIDPEVLFSTFGSIKKAFNIQESYELSNIEYGEYGDSYNSHFYFYCSPTLPIELIDWINYSWLSLVIYWENSDGEDEKIIKLINSNLEESFDNFIEHGIFKVLD
jgi:hypothetical protein